jgi:hypothetical protein
MNMTIGRRRFVHNLSVGSLYLASPYSPKSNASLWSENRLAWRDYGSRGLAPGWQTKGADIH